MWDDPLGLSLRTLLVTQAFRSNVLILTTLHDHMFDQCQVYLSNQSSIQFGDARIDEDHLGPARVYHQA